MATDFKGALGAEGGLDRRGAIERCRRGPIRLSTRTVAPVGHVLGFSNSPQCGLEQAFEVRFGAERMVGVLLRRDG